MNQEERRGTNGNLVHTFTDLKLQGLKRKEERAKNEEASES